VLIDFDELKKVCSMINKFTKTKSELISIVSKDAPMYQKLNNCIDSNNNIKQNIPARNYIKLQNNNLNNGSKINSIAFEKINKRMN